MALLARVNRHSVPVILALLLVALAAAACTPGDPGRSTGDYPIDIFPEMHYQESFRSSEPPRIMPPANSVPVTGGILPVGNVAQEKDTPNPLPSTSQVIQYGALIYERDCSFCHGQTGGGNGLVGKKFAEYGAPQPFALDSQIIQGLTPGQIFSVISNGLGPMPPVGELQTETERWAIVAMIKATANQRDAALKDASSLTNEQRTLQILKLKPTIAALNPNGQASPPFPVQH